MGIDNKNKKAMEKEFALLPTNIQKKLWEFGFDIEGEFKIPYGYLNGTSKVLINKKQELINNKSTEGVDLPDWLQEETKKGEETK